jgi:hypothetical protein
MVPIVPPRVPVAARELPRNHFVRAGDVQLVPAPANLPLDTIAATDQIVERYLRAPKARGATFLENDVAATPVLPLDGARLLSLGLEPHNALGGFLDCGQLVDVVGTPKGGADAAPAILGSGLRVVTVAKQTAIPAVIVILELPADAAENIVRCVTGATDLRLVVRPA